MKSSKILIAEDDTANRENLMELLTICGYEVRAFADGEQALDAFIQERYELIITDLKMPRMGGLELFLLRKPPALPGDSQSLTVPGICL